MKDEDESGSEAPRALTVSAPHAARRVALPVREDDTPEVVPARMINEVLYCERLLYLEWAQAEFEDNLYTVDGKLVHARVDVRASALPAPPDDEDEEPPPFERRSVWLTSERLGITAKIDLVEGEGGRVRPVEYKRGKAPAIAEGAYALLTKDVSLACTSAGFDPLLGFFHRPRYGRPALALDLMEEMRPLLGDSTVIAALNTGVVGEADFERSAGGVALSSSGRKRFIAAYERRMDQLVTHPVFGYRLSYRRVLEVQARLLARHVLGEIDAYPAFRTR